MTPFTLPDGTTIDLETTAGIQAGADYIASLVANLAVYGQVTTAADFQGGGFIPQATYASLLKYQAAYASNPGAYVGGGDSTQGRVLILQGVTSIDSMLTHATYTNPLPTPGPTTGGYGGGPVTNPVIPGASAPASDMTTILLYAAGAYIALKMLKAL